MQKSAIFLGALRIIGRGVYGHRHTCFGSGVIESLEKGSPPPPPLPLFRNELAGFHSLIIPNRSSTRS